MICYFVGGKRDLGGWKKLLGAAQCLQASAGTFPIPGGPLVDNEDGRDEDVSSTVPFVASFGADFHPNQLLSWQGRAVAEKKMVLLASASTNPAWRAPGNSSRVIKAGG